MSEKVKYNLSVVKAQKYQDHFLWFFLGCFVILCLVLFFFFLADISSYTGIYSCNTNICQIDTVIDLNTMYDLETNWKILIDGTLDDLNIIQFGEFVKQGASVGQEVSLRVSKQDYFNSQTVSFQIIKSKNNFWQIFLDILKGGDA